MSTEKPTLNDVVEKPVSEDEFNDEKEPGEDDGGETVGVGDGEESAVPEWAIVPAGLKIPPGATVYYVRLRAKWTSKPQKGDRQCIMWGLTDAEENVANDRAKNSQFRFQKEMAKMMIRAIDGHVADRTGVAGKLGNVSEFWNDIGPKCRVRLTQIYFSAHSLSQEENVDFLSKCLAVNTAMPG